MAIYDENGREISGASSPQQNPYYPVAPQSLAHGAPGYPGYAEPPYQSQFGPTPQPKKNYAWVAILVVGVALICCIGASVFGYFTYKVSMKAIDTATQIITSTNDYLEYSTTDTDEVGESSSHGNMMVDDELITITLGSDYYDKAGDWYIVDCIVKNDYRNPVYISFDEIKTVDGEDIANYTHLDSKGTDDDSTFPRWSTTNGELVFLGSLKDVNLNSLEGTLVIVDAETQEVLERVRFDLADYDSAREIETP
jgi:hypothetical protein